MTQIAQNTLEKLVKALVEHPEEVVVTRNFEDVELLWERQSK